MRGVRICFNELERALLALLEAIVYMSWRKDDPRNDNVGDCRYAIDGMSNHESLTNFPDPSA